LKMWLTMMNYCA